MAFTTKSVMTGVAGTMSLALLAGCPATPTAPVASAVPSTTPSTTATTPAGGATATPATGTSASPSTGASDNPASPGATPTTAASAPAPNGQKTIVSGVVYDESGATVDGSTVTVTSQDASVPYTATVTTSAGSYVINDVPVGANVKIIVTKDGFTSRTRVGSFQNGSSGAVQRNQVDFGYNGANTTGNSSTDISGAAYFISKFPEVASVTPAYDSSNIDNTTVNYVMTMSEPLDATNQVRFANAVRLFPANSYAAPDNILTNTASITSGPVNSFASLKDQRVDSSGASAAGLFSAIEPTSGYDSASGTAQPQPLKVTLSIGGTTTTKFPDLFPYDYVIKNNTQFLNDANTRATITWDATGKVATLAFNAPLTADRNNQARYQLGIVNNSSTDSIVDKDNNPLGVYQPDPTSTTPSVLGTLGANQVPTNTLIHSTIANPNLALNLSSTGDNTSTARWIATHQDVAQFAVKTDNTDPALVSAAYSQLTKSSRIELSFSKPMATFNGRVGGHVDPTVSNGTVLDGLTFAISNRTNGTANVTLKGGNNVSYFLEPGANVGTNPTSFFGSPSSGGGTSGDIEKEFALSQLTTDTAFNSSTSTNALFTSGSGQLIAYGTDINVAEGLTGSTGKVLLAVNASNPKTLFIYFVGRRKIFDSSIIELKVRAQDVRDPAGNSIKSDGADKQQITTSITSS